MQAQEDDARLLGPAGDDRAEQAEAELLDVQEVADRFKAWCCQDRLGYVQQLEARAPPSKLAQPGSQLPPNVQPSQLQLKLCGGSNRLSQTLLPACNPDGLTFVDQPAAGTQNSSSSSSPDSINWQFGLLLLNAQHVGPTGFGSAVQPARHVARCCIFDRQNNRFIGNVHSMPVSEAKTHKGLGSLGSCWIWDSAGPQAAGPAAAADGSVRDLTTQQQPRLEPVLPGQLAGASSSPGGVGAAVAAAGEALVAAVGSSLADDSTGGLGGANACVVRCAELSPDPVSGLRKLDGERLSLYVELSVAFRLMAEDAEAVPQEDAKVGSKAAAAVPPFAFCSEPSTLHQHGSSWTCLHACSSGGLEGLKAGACCSRECGRWLVLNMCGTCLPAGWLQGAGLVDEVTTCWAQISLKRCAELVREMTISVPLYYGSLFEPVSTVLGSDRRAMAAACCSGA